MTAGDISGRRFALALLFVLLVFAGGVLIFAPQQNVWIDESTQLSGMTLSPAVLISWLAGAQKMAFGVPADRSPPLGYLVDHAGWLVWGSEPLFFRLFHAALLGGAIVLLLVAVARRFGTRAALLTGLILALSPKFIDIAVEIRAYPLFAAISCAQIALLLGRNVAARPGRLALFVLLGVLSAYTHFFGVIATSAYFVAIFIDAPKVRDAIRAIAAYVAMGVLWIGLAPFVAGASAISSSAPPPAPGLRDLAAFLFQLVGASAQMVTPTAAFLYFGGAALLVVLGALGLLTGIWRERFEARHNPAVGLALALAAGVAVTVLAGFAIKGFSTLSPRYNIWTFPLLAVLIALAADGVIGLPGKIAQWARLIGLALFAAGAVWTQAAFLSRPGLFVHGPSAALEQMLAKTGGKTAIVYIGDGSTNWSWGYFPLYWRHQDSLPQWLLTPDGTHLVRIARGGGVKDQPLQPLGALAPYDNILAARIDLKTYDDLRTMIADGAASAHPLGNGNVAPALAGAGWRGGEALARPGFYALKAQIYTKRTER